LIRKLLVGGAVAAVAALALLLTVGSPAGKPQPAEAVVASISTTTATTPNGFWAKLHIVAEDDIFGEPFNSLSDVRVTATAGDFGGEDGCAILIPVWIQVGCAPQLNPVTLVNPSCYYDELLGLMPCVILASNGFPQIPGFPQLTGPADRDIVICNTGESIGLGDDIDERCAQIFDLEGDDAEDFNVLTNVTEIELWWQSPGGFPGGTVTFSAIQGTSVKTASIGVLGAPASITLKALRNASTELQVCNGTEVKVIAGVEYNFADYDTSFDNGRAVLCAIVKDSNGANLPNVAVQWSTTNGSVFALSFTGANPIEGTGTGQAYNVLTSGTTGNEGESATVTAQAGSATASVTVEFGGNPATCSIADFTKDLDIGDNIDVTATFKTAAGNKVPDGIDVWFDEVDSGDGDDNVEIADPWQDTVNSQATANIVAAIAGVSTVTATIFSDGANDATCSEAIDLSGDIHLTPSACATSPSNPILAGSKPPAGGGWGTFLFCGGTNAQLLAATGCTTTSTTIIFYNKPNGGWVAWVVGSQVAAANAEWLSMFPNEHVSIPNPTIFTANCKAPTA
jgi:hypothetical protein